jgi:tetratricopeptide (TPR) repeat protein
LPELRIRTCFPHAIFIIALLFLSCTIRSGIILDKSFLPRILILSLTLWITVFIRFRKGIAFKENIFEYSLILFYIWNLLSCSWAVSFSEAIIQTQLVFLGLSAFFIVSSLDSECPEFRSMFIKIQLMVMFFAFALAFSKMSQLKFYDPYELISVSANNNLFAAYLLISLPFAFSGYAILRGFWKYISVLAGILCVFFIIIIQSRAAYLGLSAAFFIAFCFLIFRFAGVFNKKNTITGLVAFILLQAGIFLFYSSLDITRRNYFKSKIPVWNYFRNYDIGSTKKIRTHRIVDQNDHSHLQDFDFAEEYYENANLRMIFWKKSAGLVKSHPVLGTGAGNWKIMVASVPQPPNPEHTLKNYTYSQPHNEWIGILAELGIAGFIISVFLFLVPLGFAFYRIAFSGPAPPLSAVFYASFIFGFYLFAVFDFPLKRVEHNVVFFSAWAFLLADIPQDRFSLKFLSKIAPSGISAIFLVILAFTVFLSLIRLKGEYYSAILFKNERKNDEKVIQCVRQAESSLYRITPNNLPLAWFEGVAFYRLGQLDPALACFTKALKDAPYEVRLLNDYGITLYGLHKIQEAKSVLKNTLVYDPDFDEARYNLAAIYYFTGQPDSTAWHILRCRDSEKKEELLKALGVRK